MKRKIISTLLCVSMCAALMMGCGSVRQIGHKREQENRRVKR